MQLPVQQFPVLTPGQMNPYNQAVQTGLESYNKYIQAGLAKPKLESEINAKNAYGNNFHKQAIATALSNPDAMALFGPEAISEMTKQLIAMTGPNNQTGSGGGSGLWSNFKSFLSGNNNNNSGSGYTSGYGGGSGGASNTSTSSDQGAETMPDEDVDKKSREPLAEDQPPTTMGNMNPNIGAPTGVDKGAPFKVGDAVARPVPMVGTGYTPEDAARGGSTGSTAGAGNNVYNPTPQIDMSDPSMNASNLDLGSPARNAAYAARHPSPKLTALLKQQETSINAGANDQAKTLGELQTNAHNSSTAANDLLTQANYFDQYYKKAWMTGPATKIPGISQLSQLDDNTAQAKNASNNMAVQLASSLFGTKVSDYREKLAQGLKLDPTQSKATEAGVMQKIQLTSSRAREQDDFVQYMISKGIKDPNKINNMWLDYNTDRPFYDFNVKKPIKSNLGSYKDYVNKKMAGKDAKNTSAIPIIEHNGKKYRNVGVNEWEEVNG